MAEACWAMLWGIPPGPATVGDTIRVFGHFESIDHALDVDPDTVTFKVRGPDRVIAEHVFGAVGSPVEQQDPGLYYLDLELEDPGAWAVRLEGEGTHGGVRERRFQAEPSVFA